MKNPGKQIYSYLLILCIAVSTFPWILLHHHQNVEISCENIDVLFENDKCYRSTFQTPDFLDLQCDHKNHIDREHNHCDFCKFITSRHNNNVVSYNYSFQYFDPFREQIYFEPPFCTVSFPDVIFNRGPPA